MKHLNPTLVVLFLLTLLLTARLSHFPSAPAQTRQRKVSASPGNGNQPDQPANESRAPADVVKVDVDLVTIDALVLRKNSARIVGGLKKDDFLVYEDGAKQTVTHFSQDSLPLSVLLLIDRGGCLDPFGSHVHRAANDAIARLKPADEVAVMTYHDSTRLLQRFTRNRALVEDALNRVPDHDEEADHCLNKVFADAADYMEKAANPVGRRVVIAITGVTRNFDCRNGPSGKEADHAILESGSVVCGIIPRSPEQQVENGVMVWATRMGHLGGAPYLDIETLANETGGEVLQDKPENLDTTFQTLMDHLRSRYSLGFVSTNKKRDGTVRKLKVDVAPAVEKSEGSKVVVKSRRSYLAPKA